jgi:C4-dicarboxylate transporter DctM subunit
MSTYCLVANRHLPPEPMDPGRIAQGLRRGIWALMMPVILLGGIYSGIFSATEAAAIALAYSVFVELFLHRDISLGDLFWIAVDTTKLFGVLFPLVAIAMSLNLLLATQQVPDMLAGWLTSVTDSKLVFILGLNLLLLAVGCVMEIASAILILAPILLPVAMAFGIDPVHLGIIMVINLEIGFLTPPLGLNLIVAMSAFREKFWLIARGALPFVGIMLAVLLAISLVPELSLFPVR